MIEILMVHMGIEEQLGYCYVPMVDVQSKKWSEETRFIPVESTPMTERKATRARMKEREAEMQAPDERPERGETGDDRPKTPSALAKRPEEKRSKRSSIAANMQVQAPQHVEQVRRRRALRRRAPPMAPS